MSKRMYLRDPKKEAYWRQIIRRQQKSGLNVRQFCQKEKISENSFYSWRREIKKRDAQQSTACGPSQGREASDKANGSSHASQQNLFAPVVVVDDHDQGNLMLEIVFPSGEVLRAPSGFDGQTLSHAVRALQQTENRQGEEHVARR